MAKISRVNIAITGDSKGLQAATTAATRDLARLNAAADATNKKLKAFGESSMRAQGALGQFGIGGKGLGMMGGLAQLGAMGGMGLGLGAAGLAFGAGTLGVTALQGLPDVRKRAIQALEDSQTDQRKRIEESGFSRLLAQQIAKQGASTNAAQNLGLFQSFQAGLASGPQSGVEFLTNDLLKFGATQIGALLSGNTLEQSNQLAAAQISTGDSQRDMQRLQDAQDALKFMPIANMLQYFMSK